VRYLKGLKLILISLTALIILSTLGFMLVENLGLIDALYTTINIVTAVGMGEVHSFSTWGRIFGLLVIISGVCIFALGIAFLTSVVIEGELKEYVGRGRLKKMSSTLNKHCIICGAGTGIESMIDMLRPKFQIAIIDHDPTRVAYYLGKNIPSFQGDATREDMLIQAGIEKAEFLLSRLSSDAENVYVSMTAKKLNPAIRIITEAYTEESIDKLKLAGADVVISGRQICNHRMATAVLRPAVVDFLDTAMHGDAANFILEELDVPNHSPLANKSIREAAVREKTGAVVMLIKKGTQVITNPDPTTILSSGDRLIILGNEQQVERLVKLVQAK